MHKFNWRISIPFIILIFCSHLVIQAQQSLTTLDRQKINNMITEANHDFNKIKENNYSFESWKNIYASDACLFVSEHNTICGFQEVRDFFIDFLAKYNSQFHREARKVDIYDDTIMEEGNYSFYSCEENASIDGHYLTFWKNEQGKWKIYREVWDKNEMKL